MKKVLNKKQKKEKRKQLKNSRPLDIYKTSDFPEAISAIDEVYAELKKAKLVSKRYSKKWRDHTRVIMLNLFVAYKTDQKMYVTYSRNSNDYRPGTRNNDLFLSHRITTRLVDFLEQRKYVENVRGYNDKINPIWSRQSRMKAKNKLIRLMDGHKIVLPMIRTDENEPLVILKDEEKNPIPYDSYKDKPEVIAMTKNLKIINRNLRKHAILLEITDDELRKLNKLLRKDPNRLAVDFTRKRLRRIFNNSSFKQGGRFYDGWWQNIPRDYRKHIRINDKDVVELDYSGLHINMLYAMAKEQMPKGDVYKLNGYSNDPVFRKFVKQMLLIMLNGDNRNTTRWVLREEVHTYKTLKLPQQIPSTAGKHLFPLMDAFEQKHKPISKYFHSGIGIKLQFSDSQIAEKVMLHFSKMHYAILPVHDSFIIHHGLEKELEDAMNKAFHEMFGVNTKIDLKFNSIDIRTRKHKAMKNYNPVCEKTFAELMEAEKPYSIYFRLLEDYRSIIKSIK